MTNTPYDFIETEEEQDDSTMTAAELREEVSGEAFEVSAEDVETKNLEELYPEMDFSHGFGAYPEHREIDVEDVEIDADELAKELDEEVSNEPPTLLESVIQFLKRLV